MPFSLPPAPDSVVHERGIPAFGVYRGIVGDLSWRALQLTASQRLTRKLHHKRWQYAAFAHRDFFIGVAVVDVGWTGSGFAYLFDRASGQVSAAFSGIGLPALSTRVEDRVFGDATFQGGGGRIAFRHAGTRLELTINSRQLQLAAHIVLPPPQGVLAAIAPANWHAHATHKSGALAVDGWVQAGGARLSLQQAIASLDASNGLLAHHTHWRWASAHAPGIGFNLQAGYMGDAENAVWLDGVPWRVGAASFDYDAANPLAPWRVHTSDGAVELSFTPEGARREDKNLLIAASRYVQPVGTFSGRIIHPASGVAHPVAQLLGVTEDHDSRW